MYTGTIVGGRFSPGLMQVSSPLQYVIAFPMHLHSQSAVHIQFIGHIIGAAFASAAPAIPSWETGLGDGEDFGRFLVAILEPIGNFGKFLVVLGALTVTAPCAITMYSFGR